MASNAESISMSRRKYERNRELSRSHFKFDILSIFAIAVL